MINVLYNWTAKKFWNFFRCLVILYQLYWQGKVSSLILLIFTGLLSREIFKIALWNKFGGWKDVKMFCLNNNIWTLYLLYGKNTAKYKSYYTLYLHFWVVYPCSWNSERAQLVIDIHRNKISPLQLEFIYTVIECKNVIILLVNIEHTS